MRELMLSSIAKGPLKLISSGVEPDDGKRLEKREISDDPMMTDLDTMEEELNAQQLLGQWDPSLFDFLVRVE